MSVEMIIVSSDILDTLIAEVRGLRADVQAVQLQPKPRWITIAEYAAKTGRSESTVQRHIREGKLDVNDTGTARMVPNPDTERNG